MRYRVTFEVDIPKHPETHENPDDEQIQKYFKSEVSFGGIGDDNPLEYWCYENCTEKLKIERIG